MINVVGIKITDRIKEAGLVQGVLTKYASIITTRLGFHEVTDEVCSREAYIILHINGRNLDKEGLKYDLDDLGGIEVREMIFSEKKEEMSPGTETGSVEILGILVKRDKDIIMSVQELLTSYGCNIRTRLGVNEIFFGEPAGLIILELKGDIKQRNLLVNDLRDLKNVHVRTMVF